MVIFFQCSESKSVDLSNFEESISNSDLEILNKWVVLFDEIFEDNYSKDEKGKILLFEDILNSNTKKWNLNRDETCKLLKDYNTSTLEYKYIKKQYDTVYYSEKLNPDSQILQFDSVGIVSITQEQDTSYGDDILLPPSIEETIENKIEYIKEQGYCFTLNESSFFGAINNIESKDSIVLDYIYSRNLVGLLNYQTIVANGIRNEKMDLNNEIWRKIFVFEVLIKYIEKEYGC